MGNINMALDELENQVLLYRYSVRRNNPKLSEEEIRNLMRSKVNRKFQKENKKLLKNMLQSHLDLLNSVHEG